MAMVVHAADAHADVAPPAHLKRVSSRAVFTNTGKAKGYSLVLLESSGPGSPGCRPIAEGKPLSKISYRWFSIRVVAVKGTLAKVGASGKLDKAACAKLAADKTLPRSKPIYVTSTIKKKIPAKSVHTVYAIEGVSGSEVKLSKPVDRFLGADGKALTQKQLASSCVVSGARPGGLALVLLLGLGLALLRRRV
jgi:hypothetical protein